MALWRPIQKCPRCGGSNLELHEEEEYYVCHGCGASGGGANFWQRPLDPKLDSKIEEIASDAVEHVTKGQSKSQITNKGKSIIANAIAEAMKDAFKESE